jgi:hypothetical protein
VTRARLPKQLRDQLANMFCPVGTHTPNFQGRQAGRPSGRCRPADSRFAINRAFGIEVPPGLIASADEAIERALELRP